MLTKEECRELIARGRAGLKALRIADPLVYGVKRTDTRWGIRYHTIVGGVGWSQCIASDFNHGALGLYSTRDFAQGYADSYNKRSNGVGQIKRVYEVYTLKKTELAELPCFDYYRKYEVFCVKIQE